jgi:hypothetical protein
LGSIGFSRVDKLIGKSPAFQNADYIHKKFRIVVELKIIKKDFFKEGGIIDSLQAVVPAGPHPFTVDGALPPGQYTVTIPPKNREGKHDNFEEPLRRSLKKANAQLRETIKELLDGSGHGVVIIAFHMPTLIDIYSAFSLVDKLAREFSSITGFLVCVPVMAVKGADISCIHGVHPRAPELIARIISEIGDWFCDFFYLEPEKAKSP